MQQKRSKRYRAAAEQVDRSKPYNLNDAVATLKKFPPTKFDQTVTVSFRLGVDPKQSDQMVRGTCPLPHGSGKQVRVLVFAEGAAAKAARRELTAYAADLAVGLAQKQIRVDAATDQALVREFAGQLAASPDGPQGRKDRR